MRSTTFLTASLTLPLARWVLGIDVLGMLTGGMVSALIRTSIRGAKKPPVTPQ